MQSNLDALRGKTEDEMFELLCVLMDEYRANVERANLDPADDIFRIHWDGDFFSVEYARAWARVIREHPNTKFWVYTRSFRDPVNVIPELYGIKNLALYLSVDIGNIDDANKIRADYPRILMAFCAKDQYQAEQLALRAEKTRTTVCPENIGKIAMMSEGKGACVHCKLCPKSRPNILFVDSKQYDTKKGQESLLFPEEVPVVITRAHKKPSFDESLI
jgi:ferredoxin